MSNFAWNELVCCIVVSAAAPSNSVCGIYPFMVVVLFLCHCGNCRKYGAVGVNVVVVIVWYLSQC